MIRTASDFFDKALSRDWKESEERSVSLPDVEADTFRLYLHWLYFKKLPVRREEGWEAASAEYLELAKAYVLGDVLQDFVFNDAVIDAMIDKSRTAEEDGARWVPADSTIVYIYNNTMKSSKVRELLLDFYVYSGHEKWIHHGATPEHLPWEFLRDLAIELLKRRTRPSDNTTDNPTKMITTCKYHHHGSKDQCYKSNLDHGNPVEKTRSRNG